MPSASGKVRHAGTWKTPIDVKVRHAGVWKTPVTGWVRPAGGGVPFAAGTPPYPVTYVYEFVGAPEVFTVPTGVTALDVDLYGAAGAAGTSAGGSGGRGGGALGRARGPP